MSLVSARRFLEEHAPDITVHEMTSSTATVALAAREFGVSPALIAKTLSLRVGDRVLLVVIPGDRRLDSKKAKAAFGGKTRMLDAAEVEAATGHPVGGVCPFGVPAGVSIYCDVALRAFGEVWPAAGAVHTAVCIAPERMASITGATWVDVCQEVLPADM